MWNQTTAHLETLWNKVNQKPSSRATVSCCPRALLANQDIFKHASPAAEQRLTLTEAWPQPLLQRAFLPSLLWPHSLAGSDSEQLGRLEAGWELLQCSLPSPADPAEKPQFRCTRAHGFLQTPVKYRNTLQCTASHSSSSWLLPGYTTHLPQHLSGTDCTKSLYGQTKQSSWRSTQANWNCFKG